MLNENKKRDEDIFLQYNTPMNEAGWYIIGGCTLDSKISSSNCSIGVIYKYEKEYGYKRVLESENLQPGKGYWILINNVMDQAKLKVEANQLLRRKYDSQ